MQCLICKNNNLRKEFSHIVLKKYNINYFFCSECGFLQTEKPFWLNESYDSPINLSDTGYASRNLNLAKRTWLLFFVLFGKNQKYLDYAGGYGLLTRFLRDFGLDFYVYDKYTKNLFAQKFDFKNEKIKAISCFECFEHFSDPIIDIEKILLISKNVFFSTTLIGDTAPNQDWWYYGFEHGQHISFYSLKTLKYIAKKNKLFFYSNKRNFHLFTERKISNFLFLTLIKLGILPWDLLFRIFTKSKTWTDYKMLTNS